MQNPPQPMSPLVHLLQMLAAGHGQPVQQTSHYFPEADFDGQGTMGQTGPSLGEAQTDEVGAERRMQGMRDGNRGPGIRPSEPYGERTDLRGGRSIIQTPNWPENPSAPARGWPR